MPNRALYEGEHRKSIHLVTLTRLTKRLTSQHGRLPYLKDITMPSRALYEGKPQKNTSGNVKTCYKVVYKPAREAPLCK
eukprot:3700160-Pleurochrysis_carterae.AAC.1